MTTTPATPATPAAPPPAGAPGTLHGALARHAAERPDAPAMLFDDRRIGYAHLHRESNRTAHALRAAGLGPGDRVAYLGRDTPVHFELALACAKIGAVLVPVNWRLSAPEVKHIVADSGAAALFAESALVPLAEGGAPALTVPLDERQPEDGAFAAFKSGAAETDPDPGTGPEDPVLQIYTSGTTGLPKGVVLAHRAFFAYLDAVGEDGADWFDWRPTDVGLGSFPGSSIAGMSWFMQCLISGVPTVVMRAFVADEAVRLVRRHGVTITFAAPAMLHLMLSEPRVDAATFRTFRKVAYGAAPISDALLSRCLEVMDCQFAQIYASTEAGSVATVLPPADHVPGNPRLRSVGRACPGNELRITDRDGRDLPPGEIGQVAVRTAGRMLGYWRNPEATAATVVDGWLLMGDAGLLDEDGYLYLRDRINDVIIVAGQNIYPAEVENALASHPDVADSAVIGIPDEQWGERVCAYVVPKPGRTLRPRELMVHLRGRLADVKSPTAYEFVDSLPRNPTGKVLRRVLRERHATTTQEPQS